jgi:hypothetical protein
MPAREGGATRTGAGVRKPPMEETAGGVARWPLLEPIPDLRLVALAAA